MIRSTNTRSLRKVQSIEFHWVFESSSRIHLLTIYKPSWEYRRICRGLKQQHNGRWCFQQFLSYWALRFKGGKLKLRARGKSSMSIPKRSILIAPSKLGRGQLESIPWNVGTHLRVRRRSRRIKIEYQLLIWRNHLNRYTYCAVWFLESHQEYNKCCGWDEEDLHEGIVQWDIVHEEVHISKAENQEVDFLCLTRETYNKNDRLVKIHMVSKDLKDKE